MPKVNVFHLRRPAQPEEERTFTDPAQPGHPLTLRLRKLDTVSLLAVQGDAAAMAERYAVNYLPLPGGPPLRITKDLAETCCLIAGMQCGDPEGWYTAEEVAAILANYPQAAVQIIDWAGELNSREDDRGNGAGAAGS